MRKSDYDVRVQGRALWEGRWILAVLLLLWGGALIINAWLAVFISAAILFTLYFFRDPARDISTDEKDIVSPADGKVDFVDVVDDAPYFDGPALRVSIFLSVFDVHVNRAPIHGEVVHSEHKLGEFLDARNPYSATKNERRTWLIKNEKHQVVVRQITGAIARRIVAWSQVGDHVKRGERFGMIRFGSRTDLFLPANASACVKVGDRVQGGATIIAQWKTE
ncbi:MAG: phosphatidylserine decarboxylase family protein [Chthoniobacterales bacterium]